MKAKRMKEDKETKKNKFILIKFVIIIIVAVVAKFVLEEMRGTRNFDISLKDNSKEIHKNIILDNIQIKDVEIKEKDGFYYFNANLENTTKENCEERDIKIIFFDTNNTNKYTFKTHINEIKPKEIESIELITTINLLEFENYMIEE